MTEVELCVLLRGKPSCSLLYVEIKDDEVTCKELVNQLVEDRVLEYPGRRGAWHLVQRWNGCERQLADDEGVMESMRGLGKKRLWLKYEAVTLVRGGSGVNSVRGGSGVNSVRRRKNYLQGALTPKKISYLRHDLRYHSITTSSQASSLWLQRLAQGKHLKGDFPLEPFRERLAELKLHNLKLSTEIGQLHISAGSLHNELYTLITEEYQLIDDVRALEDDVRAKRQERDSEARSQIAHINNDIIRLKRELEVRNRLNSVQSSKLQSQQTLLKKKKELMKSHDSHMTQSALSHDIMTTPPLSRASQPYSTPQADTLSHTSSNSTRKRRETFKARTKQLLEDEREVFKRQREGERNGVVKQLKFSSATPTNDYNNETLLSIDMLEEGQRLLQATPTNDYNNETLLSIDMLEEGQRLLQVPEADINWYKSSPELCYREKIDRVLGEEDEVKGQSEDNIGSDFFNEVMASVECRQSVGVAKKKKVCFSYEAIILSASLEGDVETLRECVEKLGSCSYTSYKGATCLHNAVCSGSQACIEYLIEMGCDINSQDDDGWTPLHCAVAYSNVKAVEYLLNHGASQWLLTEEDTSLTLGERELAAQREIGDEANVKAALYCLTLLHEAQGEVDTIL